MAWMIDLEEGKLVSWDVYEFRSPALAAWDGGIYLEYGMIDSGFH